MLQAIVEIPYVLLQALLFSIITYPAINFYWSAFKVFWYFYTVFCTFLFYTYFGMLLVSLAPSYLVASVLAGFWYTMLNLFSGYLIPGPVKPTPSLLAV
jgi:ABC-type multidrug transport system permease subunit